MICWITKDLGTAAYAAVGETAGFRVLDVRDLVDRAGNRPADVRTKIDEGLAWLRAGEKVVVCCDLGMSRSNAVAAGILSAAEGISVDDAIRRVLSASGNAAMHIDVLAVVREALGRHPAPSLNPPPGVRLLVTGASGFLGSHVVRAFGEEVKVLAPTRDQVDLERDAVRLDLAVKENGINTVLHLASPRIYTTTQALGASLVMLKNVLDVCRQNAAVLVYVSSWEVYSGYKAAELRADESLAPRPGGTYGLAKVLCENMIEHYHKEHGLARTLLRSSPVYGVGSDRPRFLWNFLHQALRDEEIVTHAYRNGLPSLDLLHVDDLTRALLEAVRRRPQVSVNVGSGVGTSTAEVARLIVERLGSRSLIRQVALDASVGNIVMDTRLAGKALGWRAEIGLREGLESVIQAAAGE